MQDTRGGSLLRKQTDKVQDPAVSLLIVLINIPIIATKTE